MKRDALRTFVGAHPGDYLVDTRFTDYFGRNATCAADSIFDPCAVAPRKLAANRPAASGGGGGGGGGEGGGGEGDTLGDELGELEPALVNRCARTRHTNSDVETRGRRPHGG